MLRLRLDLPEAQVVSWQAWLLNLASLQASVGWIDGYPTADP
jgi:hypothetical protein